MISNPTGRQFILNPSQKFSNLRGYLSKAMMLILLFTLVGCSSKSGKANFSYKDPAEALEGYESYLTKVSNKKDVKTKELISLMQEWKELDDTIVNRFFANAYSDDATANDSSFVHMREQIIDNFTKLVDTRKRSLADYLDIVTEIKTVQPDTATRSLMMYMHRFYGAMDKTPTYKLGNAATVLRYEQALTDVLDKGIRSKQDVFAFLKAEDKSFRSFLEHLPSLGNIQLTKVRDNTSLVLKQVVDLADEKVEVFSQKEIVTILTMRNNRRLIQNSLQCVNDIRAGKVGEGDQSAAYMWMLLQPWVSFDAHAFSLMSEAQLKTMRIIATETPQCITKLGNPDFPIDPNELPALLIKTFITTL
jgi:hypothetical protein